MDILIIEDDPVIGKAVQKGLAEAGHDCEWVKDGPTGLLAAKTQKHDVIILDLLIPGESGLVILEKVRKDGIKTPILILTALDSVDDRVAGLKKGADDYLGKPFDMAELLARVEALSRRSTIKPSAVLQVGELVLDLPTRRVTSGGVDIELTPTEFSILEMLMRHAGQVVTRKMLCESLWESDWEGTTNVIEVHINRLRTKLQRGSKEPLIHTVRGRGYALAQRARELFSTLRFRLVVWITLVVFLMVVVTNIGVREVEQRALQQSYDRFLTDSLEDVNLTVARFDPENQKLLFDELTDKVKANKNRSWFVQLFDGEKRPIWSSPDAPVLPPPTFAEEINGPFDDRNYRVYEKKLRKTSGETYYVRCGFLQIELQEDIDVLNRSILLASISILLAAPLGAYIITLRATRPITQIINTTAQLQPSNLNERLPIRGTGDEIDQLSKTINGMLDRIASFIDQNRDFVANAAHELRSPLAAIRSSVEVCLNRNRTPEEYTAILMDVIEEVSRLAALINRLLILAESDAGRLAGKDQHSRLDKIVRESVEMFEAVAEMKGVRLTLGETASALVPGDETHLRQVVRNLIDNAIKYNHNPGEVVVGLRVDSARKQALLVVRDTGIGIDKDVLPRIFERFYRADKARTREQTRGGYGLGLSICQSVIHALQGEIAVESEAGRGSTFTICLPLVESGTVAK